MVTRSVAAMFKCLHEQWIIIAMVKTGNVCIGANLDTYSRILNKLSSYQQIGDGATLQVLGKR